MAFPKEKILIQSQRAVTTKAGKTLSQLQQIRGIPPCMQQLKDTLSSEGQLRHTGRMQYGLFIKGLGIGFDDCVQHLRRKYAHGPAKDKFDEEILPIVEKIYGRQGSTPYAPYTCAKIISMESPKERENHGCPFKHAESGELSELLRKCGVHSTSDLGKIEELTDQNKYEAACALTLEIVSQSKVVGINPIEHPNQYAELSRKVHRDGEPFPATAEGGGAH